MPAEFEKTMTIAIADIPVKLNGANRSFSGQLIERYKSFSSDKPAEFSVNITPIAVPVSVNFMTEVAFRYEPSGRKIKFAMPGFYGNIDLLEKSAELFTSEIRIVETTDYLLRIVFAILIFNNGGILFHGAGIIRNGLAYVFFGHSGAGKSTVARLSPNDIVINDDLVALMPAGNAWAVYATPFWNPTQVRPISASAPLAGLYRLVQDKRVDLLPIESGRALAELISNIPVIPDNPFLNAELFVRGKQILDKIPIYQLHFLPNDSFWQVVEVQR